MDLLNSEEYTTPEVIHFCEISRARLTMWLKNGWIEPSIYRATARGEKNKYSLLDVVAIQIFKQIIKDGYFRQIAGDLVERIKDTLKSEEYEPDWEKKYAKYVFFFKMDDGNIYTTVKDFSRDRGLDFNITLADIAADMAKSVYGVNISEVVKKLKPRMTH